MLLQHSHSVGNAVCSEMDWTFKKFSNKSTATAVEVILEICVTFHYITSLFKFQMSVIGSTALFKTDVELKLVYKNRSKFIHFTSFNHFNC